MALPNNFQQNHLRIVIQDLDSTSTTNLSTLEMYETGRQNFAWPNYSQMGQVTPQRICNQGTLTALPNGKANLGFWKMPYQLLTLPSFNWLQAHPTLVNASGTITAPEADNTSCNFELDQNYFVQNGTGLQAITSQSDALAKMPAYFPMTALTVYPWSIFARLYCGSGLYSCYFDITIGTPADGGGSFKGTLYSVINSALYGFTPYPQFSLAFLFNGGPLATSNPCTVSMQQFTLK